MLGTIALVGMNWVHALRVLVCPVCNGRAIERRIRIEGPFYKTREECDRVNAVEQQKASQMYRLWEEKSLAVDPRHPFWPPRWVRAEQRTGDAVGNRSGNRIDGEEDRGTAVRSLSGTPYR